MAYTPPPGNAVIFNGTGAPYAPPAGGGIVFDYTNDGAGGAIAALPGGPIGSYKAKGVVPMAAIKAIGVVSNL